MESDWLSKGQREHYGVLAPVLLREADAEIARLREEVKGLQLMLDCHNDDVECPRSCDTDG